MKKIKILLCCLVGVVGAVHCMFFAILYEDEYVYYELENLDRAQRERLETILDRKIPDQLMIRSLIVYPTFVPDMYQTIYIYYEGVAEEFIKGFSHSNMTASIKKEEECILLSYFDARKNDMAGFILENGVEHREKFISSMVIRILAVLAIMGVCLLPYDKIYKKLDGL